MSKPKYLRQATTGLCYPYSPAKAKRVDMEPWTGPLPWEKKAESLQESPPEPATSPASPQSQKEPPESPEEDEPEAEEAPAVAPQPRSEPHISREQKIKNAVFLIKPGDYAKAAFGRPRMPKLADVEELAGLDDVTVEEVLAALPR
jgi:hypothetical protein